MQTSKLHPHGRRLVHQSHSHFRYFRNFAFHHRSWRYFFRAIASRRFDYHRMNLVARFAAIRRQRLQQPHPQRLSSFQGIALREHRRATAKEGKSDRSNRSDVLLPAMFLPLFVANGTLHNFSCSILSLDASFSRRGFPPRTLLKASPFTPPSSSFCF